MRKAIFAAAIAILVWAAAVVPVPFVAVEPIPAQPVAGIVDVSGADAPEDLLFTAVQIRQTTTAGSVLTLLDDQRGLEFAPTVIPAGVDPEEFVELQERLFDESIRAAAAVGQRAAGRDVTIEGQGARVVRVIPGTPAADALQAGDVITGVEGREIMLASELVGALADLSVGEEVELTVQRDGEQVTQTVSLAELPQTGQPGLGVLVRTRDLRIDMPVEVSAEEDARVGGPSAGLMIALTVYDALTDGDLVQGQPVAGTGTIDTSGNVGPVSGVPEKVRGAVLAGAEVFLVPVAHEEAARDAAPEDLEVVAVETLDEAIQALEEARAG